MYNYYYLINVKIYSDDLNYLSLGLECLDNEMSVFFFF